MIYFSIAQAPAFLLDLSMCAACSKRYKDSQTLLLRRQLRILPRQQPQRPRVAPFEKLALDVLAAKLDFAYDMAGCFAGRAWVIDKTQIVRGRSDVQYASLVSWPDGGY